MYGSPIQKGGFEKYSDLQRNPLASTSTLGGRFGHKADLLRSIPLNLARTFHGMVNIIEDVAENWDTRWPLILAPPLL